MSESDTSKKVNIANLDSCHEARQLEENSAPPADNSRPENLTDEEWQLVQMARQEKKTGITNLILYKLRHRIR